MVSAVAGGVMQAIATQVDETVLRQRARQIRLTLTDCDGVLTDNGVYYSANGEEMKRFSIRDGMGVERLRLRDVETAIITRENSASVRKRAEKLKLRYVYCSVRDKQAHLSVILNQTGLKLDQLAYIGDDINDYEIIESISEAGLTACPRDAMPEVRGIVHYQCAAPGGHGAFRDFAEWLLRLRGED
jgi:3-deoxy-D-manno-octulosonate 8-phosphate phosphatase (KDO 8-P phosphatase)